MIFITVSKLDKSTRRDWELTLGDDTEPPSFERLEIFFNSQVRALKAIDCCRSSGARFETKFVLT